MKAKLELKIYEALCRRFLTFTTLVIFVVLYTSFRIKTICKTSILLSLSFVIIKDPMIILSQSVHTYIDRRDIILLRVRRLYKTGYWIDFDFDNWIYWITHSYTQLQCILYNSLWCIHFITHNNCVPSLPLKTSDPALQPLLQPTLMASLAITSHNWLGTVRSCQSQSHATTDDQSVSKSWIRAPCGSRDRILILAWHLRVLFYRLRAPPLTGGRVCHLS
jgi:hypothetical protein